MGIRQDLARDGNGKRIMDMHSKGMGPNGIAGVFKDNGIPAVTPAVVRGTIASHEALGSRALSKKAANEAMKGFAASSGSGNDPVPA